MKKIQVIEALADRWRMLGIKYGVASGLENYPGKCGRDIDIVVNAKDMRRIVYITTSFLQSEGYIVISPTKDAWPKRGVYAFREDGDIELGFFQKLIWGPVTLVSSCSIIREVGPFRVDPWASFAKNVLLKVLGGLPPKPFLWGKEDDDLILERCASLFGRKLAHNLVTCVKSGGIEHVLHLGPSLRRSAIVRSFIRRPIESLLNSLYWPIREVRPYVIRMFPVVAVVGLDEEVKKELASGRCFEESFFTGTVIKRLPRPGHRTGITNLLSFVSVGLSSIYNWMQDNYLVNTLKIVVYASPEFFNVHRLKKMECNIGPGWSLRKPDFVVLFEGDPVDLTHWERPEIPIEVIDKKADAKQVAREFRRIFVKRIAAKYGVHIANG